MRGKDGETADVIGRRGEETKNGKTKRIINFSVQNDLLRT